MKLTKSFHRIAKLRRLNKVVQGSQGASKTYSILQRWILLALKSDTKQLCSIVTDTFPNLRSGALKDFESICLEEGISYSSTKTPMIYKIGPWTFEFFSVDKEAKGLGGRRDRLFINEANRVPWKVARQLIARTHRERIFDFNPSSKFWAHEQYVDTGDCDFVKLTYKDNSQLPEAEIESIERHAPWGIVPDENYWRVYGMGEIGFVHGAVFKNYKEYDALPGGNSYQKMVGVDFGWEDPLCAVLVSIDRRNKRVYWEEKFYASHASYDDFARVIKSDRQCSSVNLICDHAPRDINELRKRRLQALGCDKTAGITSDIRRIKQYELFVHKDSKNLIRELGLYKWQEKRGDIIDYPVDKDNHSIDAARYASIVLMNIN